MKTLYKYITDKGHFETLDQMPISKRLITVHQTHSNIIEVFKGEQLDQIEADGMIARYTDLETYSFGIKTADCLPVLLLGSESFALIHAGWRGIHTKILQSPLLGSMNIHTALIGPSISQDSFEVQAEFQNNFPNDTDLFKRDPDQDSKLFFNLQEKAKQQIRELFPQSQVLDSCICTYKNLEYSSYRRDKTDKRNWNIFSRSILNE